MLSPRLRNKNKEQTSKKKGLWRRNLVERELFVACLLVFGASMSTIIGRQDVIHFALTWSLATSRNIFLNTNAFSGQLYTVQLGVHTYSALPPGLAFFTFAAVSLAQIISPIDPQASGVYIATYFSSIFGALAAVFFFKTARMFGSERASAFLTIVFAFGTSLWIYSRIYLPEALATFLGLASVYCLLRAHEITVINPKEKSEQEVHYGEFNRQRLTKSLTVPALTFLSGLLLGITAFVDNMAIFFFVPVFLYLIFDIRPHEISSKIASFQSFIFGTVIGFFPIWLYDIATTGNAFTAPYGSPFIGGVPVSDYTFNFGHGLYEILISPGRGLLLFTPFVFVSLVGFFYLMKERRGESLFFFGLYASMLIPISLVSDSTYFLHNTIGPSELVIAMPYILFPAISVLRRMKKNSLGSILIYVLGAASIIMTGIIALTDPVPGPTGALSGANSASPLIAVNIPLFFEQSFLTWWSFFSDSILYAILVLVFPLLLLSYWMFVGVKISKNQLKDLRRVSLESVARFGRLPQLDNEVLSSFSRNVKLESVSSSHLSSLTDCEVETKE